MARFLSLIYLLIGSLLLLFSGCIRDPPAWTINHDVVLINNSDFDVEDYAGFGPIKSGDSITIFGRSQGEGDIATAKNCCSSSSFLYRTVFIHNFPVSRFPQAFSIGPRYSKADIKFDKAHCVYFGFEDGHYNIANYEIIDLDILHLRITYRITNKIFLRVKACKPIRKL